LGKCCQPAKKASCYKIKKAGRYLVIYRTVPVPETPAWPTSPKSCLHMAGATAKNQQKNIDPPLHQARVQVPMARGTNHTCPGGVICLQYPGRSFKINSLNKERRKSRLAAHGPVLPD